MVVAESRKGEEKRGQEGNLPDIRMAKFSHTLEFKTLR